MLGERMARVLIMIGRLQQGLRRNATDVGAGAARRRTALLVFPVVDAGSGKAELRGAGLCDIASGSAADHDHIKIFRHYLSPCGRMRRVELRDRLPRDVWPIE